MWLKTINPISIMRSVMTNDAICIAKWGFLNNIDRIFNRKYRNSNQISSQYCDMKPDRVRPNRGENRFWRSTCDFTRFLEFLSEDYALVSIQEWLEIKRGLWWRAHGKGQLISERKINFGVFKSPKKWGKFLKDFCPSI